MTKSSIILSYNYFYFRFSQGEFSSYAMINISHRLPNQYENKENVDQIKWADIRWFYFTIVAYFLGKL